MSAEKKSPIRMGIVGLKFGYFHVQTLLTMHDIELVAVADRSSNTEYLKRFGIKTYKDGLELLQNEKLDALSICTSPKHRLPLIEYAAKNKMAMFIEKPLASTLAQAREITTLCEQHDATVMVGFSFRYHTAIVRLRELLNTTLGNPWLLNGEYMFDWLPAAEGWLWDETNGNGFFNENSCHLFDAVSYLLGEPVSVMAEGAKHKGSPSEEIAALTLRFESGAIAALTVGALATGAFSNYPRLNVLAEKGQAQLLGRDHMWESLSWATRGTDEVQNLMAPPESLNQTRYTKAFQHLANCIQNKQKPSATLRDGVRAVALAEAVYTSIRSGQKVQVER
ncbi:MAG: Gfo/Idh/MocA family protein [Trueperaceae bacterium]